MAKKAALIAKPKSNALTSIVLSVSSGAKTVKVHIHDIAEVRASIEKIQDSSLGKALAGVIAFASGALSVYEDAHAVEITKDNAGHLEYVAQFKHPPAAVAAEESDEAEEEDDE